MRSFISRYVKKTGELSMFNHVNLACHFKNYLSSVDCDKNYHRNVMEDLLFSNSVHWEFYR